MKTSGPRPRTQASTSRSRAARRRAVQRRGAGPARSDGPRLEHARICARIADDNRAKDIMVLDLRQATPLVDFFVVATASSAAAGQCHRRPRSTRRMKRAEGVQAGTRRVGRRAAGPDRLRRLRRSYLLRGSPLYYALEDIWGDASSARLAGPRPRSPRASEEGIARVSL